jgi:hypothetical protein
LKEKDSNKKRKSEKNEIDIYSDSGTYSISNRFIRGRFYATMPETKITRFGLDKLQKNMTTSDSMEVSFSTAELCEIAGIPNNDRIYSKLRHVALGLMENTVFIENKERNAFIGMKLIPTCKYENGIFTMGFNKDIKDLIYRLNVNGDFTIYPKETVRLFENKKGSASFRIYELLRMEMQRAESLKKLDEDGFGYFAYDYYEFIIKIGQIDLDVKEIKDMIVDRRPAKEIVEKANELNKKGIKCTANISSPRSFNRYVLKPSIKEINEISELNAELYNTGGRGKKIDRIIFKVAWKGKEQPSENEEDYFTCVFMFRDICPEVKDKDDIEKIIKFSGNSTARISAVREIILEMDHVRDFVAMMITGLKEGWDKKTKISLVRGEESGFYDDIVSEVNEEISDIGFEFNGESESQLPTT